MQHKLGNLALAAASLGLVIGLSELAFRWLPVSRRALDAEEIWRAQQKPPASGAELLEIEIAGERFPEDALPADLFAAKRRRLLFLGDSFTAGDGLQRREDRFTDLVEAALDAELRTRSEGGGLHAFNAGRNGSHPVRWAGYLDLLLPSYQPHAVIAVFFLRDGTALGTSLRLNEKDIEPIRQRASSMPLYGRSALLTFFWDRLAWRQYSEQFEHRLEASYLGTPAERTIWHRQQRALRGMAERCRALGIPFHLVIFPLLLDLDHYRFGDVEEEIQQFAEQSRIPVFSLTPGFLGKADHELWVASNDQHPNPEGHRIAAETLLPYLRAELLDLEH